METGSTHRVATQMRSYAQHELCWAAQPFSHDADRGSSEPGEPAGRRAALVSASCLALAMALIVVTGWGGPRRMRLGEWWAGAARVTGAPHWTGAKSTTALSFFSVRSRQALRTMDEDDELKNIWKIIDGKSKPPAATPPWRAGRTDRVGGKVRWSSGGITLAVGAAAASEDDLVDEEAESVPVAAAVPAMPDAGTTARRYALDKAKQQQAMVSRALAEQEKKLLRIYTRAQEHNGGH